jgi:Flp pilus assembly protein CpaB
LKGSRSALTILLALLLAATAAGAVYMVSNSSSDNSTAQAPTPVPTATAIPMVAVLTAKQDIPASTSVTADMVEVKQVLPSDKNARALSSPDEAVGKITTVALIQGEQILNSRLSDQPVAAKSETDTFAYEVPVGMRAISITYDEVIGAGALVQPGDRVDVIGLFNVQMKAPEHQATPGAVTKIVKVDEVRAATYIVQNVQVLAVAQALTPNETGAADAEQTPTPTPQPTGTATTPTAEPGAPVARPEAKSVTLAVTPDEALRMMLALREENNQVNFKLVLRAPGDTTVSSLPPVQENGLPVGDALSPLSEPLVPQPLAITKVTFAKRVLTVGDVLEVHVTVKNISDNVVKSSKNAPPEFTYTEGTAYDALGFKPEPGTYRIGLNVSGAYPTEFPYRWGMGRDVKPGESIEVVGYVKMTEATPATQYWVGVIFEPNVVVQDGMGADDITVLNAAAAVVQDRTAPLRSNPNGGAEVVATLKQGDRLEVLDSQGDWFRVRTANKQEGWVAISAVDVVPPSQQGTPVAATPVSATPVSGTPVNGTPVSSKP